MLNCKWCKRIVKDESELYEVTSNGTQVTAKICGKCKEAFNKNVCYLCGETAGFDVDGKCLNCAQEEVEAEMVRKNSVRDGLGLAGSEWTDEGFHRAISSCSEDMLSPEVMLQTRVAWLKKLLVAREEWTVESVEENTKHIRKLLEMYGKDLFTEGYKLMYYPEEQQAGVRYKKPKGEILAREGDVILVHEG